MAWAAHEPFTLRIDVGVQCSLQSSLECCGFSSLSPQRCSIRMPTLHLVRALSPTISPCSAQYVPCFSPCSSLSPEAPRPTQLMSTKAQVKKKVLPAIALATGPRVSWRPFACWSRCPGVLYRLPLRITFPDGTCHALRLTLRRRRLPHAEGQVLTPDGRVRSIPGSLAVRPPTASGAAPVPTPAVPSPGCCPSRTASASDSDATRSASAPAAQHWHSPA